MSTWFPGIRFPRMALIRQCIHSPKLDDFVSEIRRELCRIGLASKVKPGMRIAITAGSRGVAYYPEILATVVDEVKRVGGIPFLIPAMGSHGGATAEGQLEVLRELGITPDSVGAPILSTMEVEEVGRIDGGIPVYVDKYAVKADGIIVVGRVKPHTDFKDRIESGLMKMMAVGLGKHKGAETIHMYRSEGYHR
ncbi:MAG: nickel-dependent lactate racemase, partial [Candidatus Bathyarchaeota archaeon]|nr:nickel-dependent lactate racemase [Candidatus Bathyarchaeota archaeon]